MSVSRNFSWLHSLPLSASRRSELHTGKIVISKCLPVLFASGDRRSFGVTTCSSKTVICADKNLPQVTANQSLKAFASKTHVGVCLQVAFVQ